MNNKLLKMKKWSEWQDIGKNSCYNGCAIYKIRFVNLKGKPIAIPRFLNKDKDGILMIGSTTQLKRRLNNFKKATEGNEAPHTEGKRFYLIKNTPNFKKYYKNYRLQYSFKKLNKNQIKKEERRALEDYLKKYGELPLLNSILPKKKKRKKQ